MVRKKSFEEQINGLNERELLALLKKFNLIYPIELETIDKLLKDIKPIKLTLETKERFLKTMRDTIRRKEKEKIK